VIGMAEDGEETGKIFLMEEKRKINMIDKRTDHKIT
jgi:hypothetical protein